VKHPV